MWHAGLVTINQSNNPGETSEKPSLATNIAPSKDQLKCLTLAKKYLVFSGIHWENGLRQTRPFRYPQKTFVYMVSQIIVCCMSDAHCLCPVGSLINLLTLIKKVMCLVFTCYCDNDDQAVSSSWGWHWHLTNHHGQWKNYFCKTRHVWQLTNLMMFKSPKKAPVYFFLCLLIRFWTS